MSYDVPPEEQVPMEIGEETAADQGTTAVAAPFDIHADGSLDLPGKRIRMSFEGGGTEITVAVDLESIDDNSLGFMLAVLPSLVDENVERIVARVEELAAEADHG